MGKWSNKDPELQKLRTSGAWRTLRERFLSARPLCEVCELHPAREVHHIHLATRENFYNVNNLAALCSDCHERIHAAMRRGINMQIFFGDRAK